MKRREFITLLGGAAAAWPLAARAQQAERVRRIGVLMNTAADDPEGQARKTAFVQALQQFGWTDGRNGRIEYSLGHRRHQHPQIRGGTGRACPGRHRGRRERSHGRIATDDPHRADHIRDYHRPGRCRLRREPGTAGRQRHRIQPVRIRAQRQMA